MPQRTPFGDPPPILTIDCGSSSIRVIAVSPMEGVPLRELRRAPTPWHRGDPHRAEIDIRALGTLLARLLHDAERELPERPAAIAVTSVLAWVPLDREGRPAGNAITYADRRATPVLGELARRLPRFTARSGRPLTAELLLSIDFVHAKRAATTATTATHSSPAGWTSLKDHILSLLGAAPGVDEIHGAYSGFYGDEALAVTGRKRSPFAAVEPADSICGACGGPGRLAGAPLVRGTSDGSAGFYAIAAIRGGVAAGSIPDGSAPALLVSGTTEVVMTPWYGAAPGDEAPREAGAPPDPEVPAAAGLVINPAIASLLPGARAVVGGSTGTVGGLLSHLVERFGGAATSDLDRLEEEAAAVPAGAGGLTVFPALEGERLPRSIPGSAAAVLGVTAAAGRGAFARALWEAGAFRVAGLLEEIGVVTGSPPSEVWVSGGGSGNALWNAIRADVTGIPVRALPWREASTLGATMIACAALGLDGAIAATWIGDTAIHQPNEALRDRYTQLAERYRRRAEILYRLDQ